MNKNIYEYRCNLIRSNERKFVLLYIKIFCIIMNIKIIDCNIYYCFMYY